MPPIWDNLQQDGLGFETLQCDKCGKWIDGMIKGYTTEIDTLLCSSCYKKLVTK